MSQIELIRREIERQLKESEKRLDNIEKAGMVAPNEEQLQIHLKGFLAKLNTLKEQPVCEELEAEMDKFFETMPVLEHENIFEDTFKNIASHFYELGRQSKPTTAEGLEEEIEDWIECIRDSPGVGDWTMGDILSTARHFAKWGAEHAME